MFPKFTKILILVVVCFIYVDSIDWSKVNDIYYECKSNLTQDDNFSSETNTEKIKSLYAPAQQVETGTRSTSSWMIAHRLNSESETENKNFYCTFTKLGLIDEKANIIMESLNNNKECPSQCRTYVSQCSITADETDVYRKAFVNVNCVYVSAWKVTGFI